MKNSLVTYFIYLVALSFLAPIAKMQAQASEIDTINFTVKNEPVVEHRSYDSKGRNTGEWKRFFITDKNQDSLVLITVWNKNSIQSQQQFLKDNQVIETYFDAFGRIQKRGVFIDGALYSETYYRYRFRNAELDIYYYPNGNKKAEKRYKEFTVPDGELVQVRVNLKHGLWVMYDEQEKVISRTRYRKKR
ncbi:MAG: hypothetical protein HRT74_01695 [Flavobacteriales bacterium]|nr:hypothetical protein [Flavobacteriales bacterium]